jgi:hypothetical protein
MPSFIGGLSSALAIEGIAKEIAANAARAKENFLIYRSLD